MTRESELANPREGLLRKEETARPLDDEDIFESELGLEELELLEAEESSPRLRGGWAPLERMKKVGKKAKGDPNRKGGWCRNKIWWFVAVLLLGAMVGGLGGAYGGVWKRHRNTYKDGVS